MSANHTCHICGAAKGNTILGYESLRRVTSDCRAWARGGQLWVCGACGSVQKIIDEQWKLEARQIYENYSIYHQSDGTEQSVFAGQAGQPISRSARLLECVRPDLTLSNQGRLLDIGCGNGALLRAFAGQAPGWTLVGNELSDKYRREVEAIPGVQKLLTCPTDQVAGTFDLISMIHVLEHVPGPVKWLASLLPKLETKGQVLVEVPDYTQNPFDLLIADHSTHFCEATVRAVMRNAGLEVVVAARDWIPKELTVLARKYEHQPAVKESVASAEVMKDISGKVHWLRELVARARKLKLSTPNQYGIFGTSIAATWLFAELEGEVSFFVDEDPSRVGRQYLGRPVYHPRDLPAGSRVFIVLPPFIAETVRERLTQAWPACEFVTEAAQSN